MRPADSELHLPLRCGRTRDGASAGANCTGIRGRRQSVDDQLADSLVCLSESLVQILALEQSNGALKLLQPFDLDVRHLEITYAFPFMDETEDGAPPTTGTPTGGGGGSGLVLAGLVLVVVGLLAGVLLWSEMSGDSFGGPNYSTVDKWLAVLTALTPAGLGLAVIGLGMILARLERSGR